jgi:HEAT repeat protein
VPALQHAMQDSNWWVRRSALDSLRRLREAV